MKLAEIKQILGATLLAGTEFNDTRVYCVCDADLVSDVLSLESLGSEGVLLLISLIGPQLITLLSLTNYKSYCFCSRKAAGR